MPEMEGYFIHKVGNNRGAPRIWLEGQKLTKAGIAPGTRFDIVINGKTIVLKANKDGSRVVSGKMKGDKPNPIVDINSHELLACLMAWRPYLQVYGKWTGIFTVISIAKSLCNCPSIFQLNGLSWP